MMRSRDRPLTAAKTAAPTEIRLSLRLFGAFEVEQGGLPLPRTRTRKEQWLLAYLLLHHRGSLDRSRLAGMLWPDSDHTAALRNLRRSLSNLRDVLGADAVRLFSPTPQTISFDVSGAACDLIEFDAAVAQATA